MIKIVGVVFNEEKSGISLSCRPKQLPKKRDTNQRHLPRHPDKVLMDKSSRFGDKVVRLANRNVPVVFGH